MDSINQNQPEENRKNLFGTESVEKIKELVEKSNTCYFCSALKKNESFSTRPMAVQKVDENGTLWFLSASDSKKNSELAIDPKVQLLFQGSPHSDFLTLFGSTQISRDKAMIKELWNPIIKTWFTEGEDDPRITIIKFIPENGYYWDTKHGAMVYLIKRMAGAAMGKTLDDSIEGKIFV